ncbi:MAG: tetratricopeptide repeat protein [Parvibaculaceae bacterium]
MEKMKTGSVGISKGLLSILAFFAFLIPIAVQAANDKVADAKTALDAGNFSKAADILKPLAADGDASAQTNLAVLYLQGKGVLQSDKEAFMWLDKAARQGSAPAALDLGILYRNGQGVEKDLVHADMWIEVSLPNLNGPDKADATKYRNMLAKEMTDSQKQDARDMIDNCMLVGVKYCD